MSRARCLKYRRNLNIGAAVSLLVYSAAATAQTYGWSQINDLTKTLFGGATVTVLAMALTGTLIGLGLTPPVEKRKNLYILIPACTILSAELLMYAVDRGWLGISSPVMLPPLACIVSAVGVSIIPRLFKPDVTTAVVDAIKSAIGRVFNRPPPSGGTS